MASMNRYEADRHSGTIGQAVDGCLAAMASINASADATIDADGFRARVAAGFGQSLSRLIEGEIIPRLMVAHFGDTPSPPATPVTETVISLDDLEVFTALVLQAEADILIRHVGSLVARGVGFDAVLVDLLAPTARRLGTMWDDDRADFVEVTMALWRLQEIVHEMSTLQTGGQQSRPGSRRALFAPMPGDQHSFGTVMIDDIFRREAWQTDRMIGITAPELVLQAGEHWYDLIGLTVSCDCHIGSLRSLIASLRSASKNPNVCVMLGGRIFNADPDLATHVGADGTAGDARNAPTVADELVRERERAVAP